MHIDAPRGGRRLRWVVVAGMHTCTWCIVEIVDAPGDGWAEGAPVGVEERAQAAGVTEAGPVTTAVAEPCVEAAQQAGAAYVYQIVNHGSVITNYRFKSSQPCVMYVDALPMHARICVRYLVLVAAAEEEDEAWWRGWAGMAAQAQR